MEHSIFCLLPGLTGVLSTGASREGKGTVGRGMCDFFLPQQWFNDVLCIILTNIDLRSFLGINAEFTSIY